MSRRHVILAASTGQDRYFADERTRCRLPVLSCALRPPSAAATAGKRLSFPRLRIRPEESRPSSWTWPTDYIAALGEAVYLITRAAARLDAKGRWLAQSFLRNGVGASLDIAVGPNPATSLLDLLVLTSLQAWSFEAHWIPAGIGEAGRPAVDRLKRAETECVDLNAGDVLSEGAIAHPAPPHRRLDRGESGPDGGGPGAASKSSPTGARSARRDNAGAGSTACCRKPTRQSPPSTNARLLGERLLWFAGRYPYLLGEQTELTAYRLVDQPEGEQLMAAIQSIQRLSEILSERAGKIQSDLDEQQAAFFARIAAERAAAIATVAGRPGSHGKGIPR
jgi:hypothetical protein